MNRRIPAALGLVIVFAAVYSLHQTTPMLAMMVREGFPDSWLVWLLVGASVAQLVAGVAIAVSWTHARLALLAWTLVALASAILARDLLAQESSPVGIAVMYIEALAGPAIAWLVPIFVGDVPRDPRIPRARVVSSSVPLESELDTADLVARRFDVGVVLFGIGLLWIVGTIVSHVPPFAMMARAAHVSGGVGGILGMLVFMVFEIGVGVFAIRAARRLLDPATPASNARRALAAYVVYVIALMFVRTGLSIGVQLVDGDLSSDIMKMLVTQWIFGAVLAMVIPLFLWRYVANTLVDTPAQPPVVRPSPARLAAVPAFALLWFAPYLLARLFVVNLVDTNVLSRGVIGVIGIACAFQGIAHLIAAIGTFTAHRTSDASATSDDVESRASSDSSLRIARVAAIVATVSATILVLLWILVVMVAETSMSFGRQLPSGPLAQLFACAVTTWWALTPRKSSLLSANQ